MVCPRCGKQVERITCRNCGLNVAKEELLFIGSNKEDQARAVRAGIESLLHKERERKQAEVAAKHAKAKRIHAKKEKELGQKSSVVSTNNHDPLRINTTTESSNSGTISRTQTVKSVGHKTNEKSLDHNDNNRETQKVNIENPNGDKDKKRIHNVKMQIIIVGLIVVAVIAAAVVAPKVRLKKEILNNAWGPDRATFTWENPAGYAAFNSITDNPAVGDERNFVRIGEADSTEPYTDTVEVEPWKEYEIYIYYHNNASSALGDKAAAHNAKLAVMIPFKLKKDETGVVKGIISSSDADPSTVWDSAYMHASEDLELYYVEDSAILHSFGETDGEVLDPKLLFGKNDIPVLSNDGSGYKNYAGGDTDKEVLGKGVQFSPDKATPGEIPTSEDGSRGYITLRVTVLPANKLE